MYHMKLLFLVNLLVASLYIIYSLEYRLITEQPYTFSAFSNISGIALFKAVLSGMYSCLLPAPADPEKKQQCPGTPAHHILKQQLGNLQIIITIIHF